MGWYYGPERNAREVRDMLLRELEQSEYYRVIDHASTNIGRNFWLAVEHKRTGERHVLLYLINGGRMPSMYGGDISWGYKPLSEDMGPAEVDCPLRILDATGEAAEADASGYAHEWRVKVREYHKQRAERRSFAKSLARGTRFAYEHTTQTFTYWGMRGRKHLAYGDRDHILYRVSPAKMLPLPA